MRKLENILCALLALLAAIAGARAVIDWARFPRVSFETLSNYKYQADHDDFIGPLNDQIPSVTRNLDGSNFAVSGYMVPINLKNNRSSHFLLTRKDISGRWSPMPKMNEWISVSLPSGYDAPVSSEPITVFGALRVGEIFDKDETLSIYRMDAERVAVPGRDWMREIWGKR